MYRVNDWPSLWAAPALEERIRTGGGRGHLERRGHITHIKAGRESGSPCLAVVVEREEGRLGAGSLGVTETVK